MAKRHKAWARRQRAELMLRLGNRCSHCGTTEGLTFDCIIPQGDWHHRMDTSARMSFYRAQHAAGNIQILCDRCNSIKSADEIPELEAQLPF